LAWLLYVGSRPPDAILGRVPGLKGWHSVKENPEAKTVPGLLIFQFNANLVFYNADQFKARVLEVVAASDKPVEWVVLDASPFNYVDLTAVHKFEELREELASRGIKIVIASLRLHFASRYFDKAWVQQRRELAPGHIFPTIKSAVKAFQASKRPPQAPEPGTAENRSIDSRPGSDEG
jgi:MFS superfamily sulfate permease-like transporter